MALAGAYAATSMAVWVIGLNKPPLHDNVIVIEEEIQNADTKNLLIPVIYLFLCSYLNKLFVTGCVVYQWDPATHSILNKLDCSKLVPCSESLKSISIEEHLSPGKCQVCVRACACMLASV